MNKFLERIFDLIEEMAFSAKKLEDKVTGEAEIVIQHLIKILRYKDPLNYKKHILDMNYWITHITSLEPKSKISYEKYYKWIYLDWIGTENKFKKQLILLNIKYKDLIIIRSDTEVIQLINSIMSILIRQITDDTFIDLESILKELNIFDEEQYNYILKRRKKSINEHDKPT